MSVLEVNQSVTIEINAGEKNKKYYNSKIVSVSSTEVILLAPMEKGILVPLRIGDLITVSYNDDNAIYSFDAQVDRRQGGVDQTITVQTPADIRRVQRRNFVRIDVTLPMVYYTVDDTAGQYSSGVQTKVIDISGGGLRFESDRPLDKDLVLDLVVELGGGERISAIGQVVRSLPIEKSGFNKYSIGIQFTIIEERDRDKIIKFIFQKQRELRQRGLM